MKTHLRNHVVSLFLLLPVAAAVVSIPATAAPRPAAPEIQALQVTADSGLTAGSSLQFTVEGTARARASVRVRGVERNIPLTESSRGVYTGEYTIRRQDRVVESSAIQATLRVRNRSTVSNFSFPAGFAGPLVAAAPPVAVAPPPAAPPPAQLKIDRFTVAPVEKIEPGADLRFTLNGAPGAIATFDIPGVIDNVAMREVKTGVYEGSYTIRRLDNLSPSRPIVARLRQGDRVVTATLTQPLMADAKPPVLRNLTPREGEIVVGNGPTGVSASFDDTGGVGVDPKSVRILLSGRDITANSNVTSQFFSYRADLPPGRYTVDLTVKDLAGNAVNKIWAFEVANAAAAAPATLPLQITSHANNAVVEGNATTVRGRTAPGATVDVKVVAIAAIAGLFGVTQEVLSQRIQADATGNFSFDFSPKLPLPGARYEVTMVAQKADLKTESRLVLFQKQK
jgi:hypothetical protein